MNEYYYNRIERGDIVCVETKDMEVRGGLGIATLKDEYSNIATRKLVEYIMENVGKKYKE